MAGAGRTEGLSILRTLYRELRPTVNAPQGHVYETQLWKYIVGLCKTCRNQPVLMEEVQKNLEHTGRSYIFYLQSLKEYHRISDDYKGAGERSARDTATMLGFKMPDEPKPKRTPKVKVASDCSQTDSIKNSPQDMQSSSSSAPLAYSSPLR